MNRETLLNRVAPAVALCCFVVVAAAPALAQTGGIDPVTTGRNIVTLTLAVLTIVFALAWAGAAAACLQGRIPVGYFFAAGVGTITLGACTLLATRFLGGGGGGGGITL